jgi:hypothetical protein
MTIHGKEKDIARKTFKIFHTIEQLENVLLSADDIEQVRKQKLRNPNKKLLFSLFNKINDFFFVGVVRG